MNKGIEIRIPSEEIDELYQLGNASSSKNTTICYRNTSKSDYISKGLPIHYVAINENLIKVILEDEKYIWRAYKTEVISPVSGYFVPSSLPDWGLNKEELNNSILGFIFDNIDDSIEYVIGKANATIEIDPFTKNHRLSWNTTGEYSIDYFDLGEQLKIKCDFVRNECVILISTDVNEVIELHKGDTISFLFKNGDIIDFHADKAPDDRIQFSCLLYKEDIDILLNQTIDSYRITFAKEGKTPIDSSTINNSIFGFYTAEAIRFYFKERKAVIEALFPNYEFPSRNIRLIQKEYKFNWCYVYLMRDKTNGYLKIGISNKPEYREKTLQSEKPSIEMLAFKKFPTRKIAEAIESALHIAFSQQRVRGEWFNLNDEDVAAIIETLK